MRQHFPELVGLTFAAAIILVLLFASEGGAALIYAIGLGTVGVLGTLWARRVQLRRGRT